MVKGDCWSLFILVFHNFCKILRLLFVVGLKLIFEKCDIKKLHCDFGLRILLFLQMDSWVGGGCVWAEWIFFMVLYSFVELILWSSFEMYCCQLCFCLFSMREFILLFISVMRLICVCVGDRSCLSVFFCFVRESISGEYWGLYCLRNPHGIYFLDVFTMMLFK